MKTNLNQIIECSFNWNFPTYSGALNTVNFPMTDSPFLRKKI